MATVCKHTPIQEAGLSLRIKEIFNHPRWREGESKVKLNQDSYFIIEDPEKTDGNHFRLIWLNKEGEKVSILFWIDPFTFQWCFRNGQANTAESLDEAISCMFEHFKEDV